MAITPLSLEDLAQLTYEPVTELPPYNEYLPGPPAELAHVFGVEGEPGSVSAVRLHGGGIRFIEMPIVSLSTIVEGRLSVTDEDGTRIISAGGGFATPPGWSGEMSVLDSPVTMLLIVL